MLKQTRKLIDPGVPIFLNLKIYRLEEQGENLVLVKESSEQRLYSWGADSFNKTILDTPLDIGRYRIHIENLKDTPELARTQINFQIARAYRGK